VTVAAGNRAMPETAVTVEELEEALARLEARGRSLALVPTMGYLHEGHLRLVDEARRTAEAVAMTIFVNPIQFEPGEDLERYPRDLERDLRLASDRGVDLVFAPSLDEMYPDGPPSVRVDPGPMGGRLCGAHRPTHFSGVLTVVARLLGLFRPDVAVFGRKDYQQAVLVRRMVRDLAFPVRIEVGPLVREADGLALSSRNAYLSPAEREEAVGLFRSLTAADRAFRSGAIRSDAVLGVARDVLAGHPLLRVEYLELVHPATLAPLSEAREGAVVAVAARCGPSRLIDNVVLGAEETDPRLGSGETGGSGSPASANLRGPTGP
jgi:pantoate--beta-alanine ligase